MLRALDGHLVKLEQKVLLPNLSSYIGSGQSDCTKCLPNHGGDLDIHFKDLGYFFSLYQYVGTFVLVDCYNISTLID